METSDKLFELVRDVLLQLPSLLTIIGCMVAAIVRWKRHPKVSLTLVIGLVWLFLTAFVFAFVYAFVPGAFARASRTQETVGSVISFFYHASLTVGFAPILAAIFMQRDAQPVLARGKRCPRCNREYEDATLQFCLDDGARLFNASDSEMKSTEVFAG